MISVLVYQAFHICSTYQNFHDAIVRIKEILFKNCFPRALTDRIIKSFLDKRFAPRPPAPQEAKTAKRIQSFFPFKDRFPTLIRSSVVYKFQCPGCNASYVGKASRNLITRCREHLGITKAGQKIKVSSSAIWDHINPSGHAASLEDFLVLDRANNDFDLLIHESLLILRDRPSLNSQQSSIPLVLF